MVYNLNEKIGIGLQFTVLLLLSSLLYLDINRRIEVTGEKEIGTLTFKQRTVQRKYAAHLVWEDLEQDYPLRNRDSIRTTNEADAEITLKDGTKINLSENSMILLNLDENKTNIDFAYGSVSAKNEGSTGSGRLSIKSGDTSISLGNGDVKLSKDENKDLSVTLQKGEAQIVSAGKESLKLGLDEKAVLGANSDKIEIKKIDLKLVSPVDNARYFTVEKFYPMVFEIQKEATTPPLKLEIANTQDFKKPAISQKITDKQTSVSLKEGTYYWRTNSGKEVSQVRKLSITQNHAVDLISPSNGFHTPALHESMYISFAWSKNDLASNYKLDVSPNADFSSNVTSSVVKTNFVSLSLAKGKYHWRVGASVPTSEGQSGYLSSATHQFEITDQEKGRAPTLFNPAMKSVTYSILAEKKGIPFNWSIDSQVESYDFILSTSPKFESTVQRKSVSVNSLEIKEKLNPGIYYWKVTGKTKDGRESEPSKTSFFEVKDVSTFKAFAPDSGKVYSLPDVLVSGVTFNWEKLPIVGKYVLQVAEDQNFSKSLKSFTIPNNRFVLKDIGSGSFYWRVSFQTESGDTLLATSSQVFTIRYLPDEPKLIVPKFNASLVIGQTPLKFQWTKGNVTQFEIKLFQKVENKRKEIFTKSINVNDYTVDDISEMEAGFYEWSIISLGEGESRSKEITSKFQLTSPAPVVEKEIPKSRYAVTLISPIEGQTVNITFLDEILFKWNPISGIKKYKFSIHDGPRVIYSSVTPKPEYIFSKLELLDIKEFKWTVSAVTKEQNSESTSASFRIDLDHIKEKIEVLSPDVQYGD